MRRKACGESSSKKFLLFSMDVLNHVFSEVRSLHELVLLIAQQHSTPIVIETLQDSTHYHQFLRSTQIGCTCADSHTQSPLPLPPLSSSSTPHSELPLSAVQYLLSCKNWQNVLCKGYALRQHGQLLVCNNPNSAVEEFTLPNWQLLFERIGFENSMLILTHFAIFVPLENKSSWKKHSSNGGFWQISGNPICFEAYKQSPAVEAENQRFKNQILQRNVMFFNSSPGKILNGLPQFRNF